MRRENTTSQSELASFGELRLIERIRRNVLRRCKAAEKVLVVEGIGDDAAVLGWREGEDLLLFTCDTLVEKIHFLMGTPFYRVGWKAMGCNLSDIAAMGGVPQHAVVSLACPASTTVAEIDEMYAGMIELGNRFGVTIVGGDTVESPRALVVSVAVIGRVEQNCYVTRAGARPGDAVCVTGVLGGSLLGKHLDFVPRVAEGRFLALNCSPTAMIDISDGLASDLMKLMEASRTTAEIFAQSIPVSEAATRLARRRKTSPLDNALHDGEDFELLFTLRREKVDECLSLFRKNFSTSVTVIGKVKKGRSKPVLIKEDGTAVAFDARGYEHFRKNAAAAKGPRKR